MWSAFFFFNDTATTEIYTLSLHDALPIFSGDFTQTNTCPVSPATLAAGANCAVNVAFKPSVTGGRSGTITITYSFPGSPQTVSLTGTGVAPAVTLSATSIPFGNQAVGTASAAQVIGLTNSGTATLTITSIAITGANSGDFSQTNTCGASVAAGANCSVSVTFKPTAATLLRTIRVPRAARPSRRDPTA